MPRNLSDSFFGSIALKNKMLTREQLTQALRIQWEQRRDGVGPTLGEVCRSLGFLRDDQVNAIVWAQEKSEVMLQNALLGQICIRNRLLSKTQLEEAIDEQRASNRAVPLGDLLCRKGYIDRQQLHAVLTTQDRLKSGRLKPVIEPPLRPVAVAEKPAPAAVAATATKKKSGKKAKGRR